jgi:hypothetical protein
MPSSYHFLEIPFHPRQSFYPFIGQSFFSPRQSFYPSSTKFLSKTTVLLFHRTKLLLSKTKFLPFIDKVSSLQVSTLHRRSSFLWYNDKVIWGNETSRQRSKQFNAWSIHFLSLSTSESLGPCQHQPKRFPKGTAIVASTLWTCILLTNPTPICLATWRLTPNIDPSSSRNRHQGTSTCDIPRCEACRYSKQKRRSFVLNNRGKFRDFVHLFDRWKNLCLERSKRWSQQLRTTAHIKLLERKANNRWDAVGLLKIIRKKSCWNRCQKERDWKFCRMKLIETDIAWVWHDYESDVLWHKVVLYS